MANVPVTVVPGGSRFFVAGDHPIAAPINLAQYWNGASFPSGTIRGEGLETRLQAQVGFHSRTGAEGDAILYAGPYATTRWSTAIRDMTVEGYSPDNWTNDNSSQSINIHPENWNIQSWENWQDRYHGIDISSGGADINNVHVYGIPGTAVRATRQAEALSAGPLARLKPNIEKLSIRRAFRGLDYTTTDGTVSRVDIEATRDYGAKFETAIQFDRIHSYGGGMNRHKMNNLRTIVAGAGKPTTIFPGLGYDSPGIWFKGSYNHGTDCYPETYPVGVLCGGSYNSIHGIYSHGISACNVVFANSHNEIAKGVMIVSGRYSETWEPLWQIAYDGRSAGTAFSVGETITFSVNSSATGIVTGITLDATNPTTVGTLTVIRVSGYPPLDNARMTGGTSGATADVNTTPRVTSGAWFEANYNSLRNLTCFIKGQSYAASIFSGENQIIEGVTIDQYANTAGMGISAETTLSHSKIHASVVCGDYALRLAAKGTETDYPQTHFGGFVKVSDGASRLGTACDIDIKSKTGSGAATPKIVIPSNWSHIPPATLKNSSVSLVINGTRFYHTVEEWTD